jgi:hypothetical protein
MLKPPARYFCRKFQMPKKQKKRLTQLLERLEERDDHVEVQPGQEPNPQGQVYERVAEDVLVVGHGGVFVVIAS